MTLTLVISDSPKIARKHAGIATAAISSGTRASAEPNTKTSTASAAAPATRTASHTMTTASLWRSTNLDSASTSVPFPPRDIWLCRYR